MNGLCGSILILASIASSAVAQTDPVYRYFWGAGGSRVVERDQRAFQSRDAFHAYDNWRTPEFGGNVTEVRGIYRYGTAEVGDDLTLTTHGPSYIRDIAFSINNLSTTSTLTQYRVTHRFYDVNRVLLGADSFTIFDAPIQPGHGTAFYSDGGFYRPFNIFIPSQVFMTIQISNVVGIDPNDIGILMVGPRTTGYSSSLIFNFTTGQSIDFDGSDQSNMRFFINTEDVPSPGTAVGLAAALGVSVRSRRRS